MQEQAAQLLEQKQGNTLLEKVTQKEQQVAAQLIEVKSRIKQKPPIDKETHLRQDVNIALENEALDNDTIWADIVGRARRETGLTLPFDRAGIKLERLNVQEAASVPTELEYLTECVGWTFGGSAHIRDDSARYSENASYSHWNYGIKYIYELARSGGMLDHDALLHEHTHLRHFNKQGEVKPAQAALLRAILFDRHHVKDKELYEAFAFVATPGVPEFFENPDLVVQNLIKNYHYDPERSSAAVQEMVALRALSAYALDAGVLSPDDPLAKFEQSTGKLIYEWYSKGKKWDIATKTFPLIEQRIDQYCQRIGIDRTTEEGKKVVEAIFRWDNTRWVLDHKKMQLIAQEQIEQAVTKGLMTPHINLLNGNPHRLDRMIFDNGEYPFVNESLETTRTESDRMPVFFPADESHLYTAADKVGYVFPSKNNSHNPSECYRVHFVMGEDGNLKVESKIKVPESEWEKIYDLYALQVKKTLEYEKAHALKHSFNRNNYIFRALQLGDKNLPWRMHVEGVIIATGMEEHRETLLKVAEEVSKKGSWMVDIKTFLSRAQLNDIKAKLLAFDRAHEDMLHHIEQNHLFNMFGSDALEAIMEQG